MRLGIAAAMLAALPPSGVSAQGSPPQDSLPADTVFEVEGVTVRALRSPLPLAALPFAVTVRSVRDQPPAAGLSLAEALRAVPGLQVQSRFNEALGERIVVRGFGARAQFGVRGIQVLVDGIPATMPDGQATLNHLDLSALDRAEVLRGPAAAAYGNAAGGVLLLSTTPPPEVPFRAGFSGSAGSHGLLRLRGESGGSAGSRGWTASATREWRDGYRPHSGSERWQLTGRADAPLGGGYLRVTTHGVLYDAENPGALTPEQFGADPYQAQPFNVTQRTGEEGRHGQLGAAWERVFERVVLEASAYGLARSLENPIPPAIIALDRGAGGARVLLRGAADGLEGIAWAAGLEGGLLGDHRRNFANEAGSRGPLTLDQSERVASLGGHGQVLIPLLDRMGLFLAARYDRVAFSADDRLVTADNPDDSGRRTMDAFSPTAGIRVDAGDGLALFANASSAFETPTTTELVNRPDGAGGFNPDLEPQRTLSIEAGARARVGPRVTLEATAYHATIEDALVPFEVPTAPGRQYFRNAAGAIHRGVELLGELRTRRVDLLAALDRTDAAFTSYTTPDDVFDGLTVPGVRPWTAVASLTARPSDRLDVQLDYDAAGAMVVDDANDTTAPGHHILGLRLAAPVRLAAGWTARVHVAVHNVLDETYVASVVPNAFGGRFYEPGPGRSFSFGARLGARSRP